MSTPDHAITCRHRLLPDLFACAGLQAKGCAAPPAVEITSLTDDSRRVERGSCFVAVRGGGYDGHDFVADAVDAGAVAVVVDRDVLVPGEAVRVRVDDTRVALAKLAAAYYGLRGEPSRALRLIGITGTNGKTTVAWLLRSILEEAGLPTALLGTIKYDLVGQTIPASLTTPGPLDLCRHLAAARQAGAVCAVLEVSSHALDQHRCDGLAFAVAVFTNLSGDHLDYHESMESYGAAKRHLFDLLDVGGVGVVNRDDLVGESLAKHLGTRVVTFGLDTPDVDLTAGVDTAGLDGSDVVMRTRGLDLPVRLSMPGRHNISNALAAAATAEVLGVDHLAIRNGLEAVSGVPGRLQRVEAPGCGVGVFVDYAHTDAALSNVLEALRPLASQRLICVFGCGGDRDRDKRPRMANAVERFVDVAYVTSDNPRTEDPRRIIDDILGGFGPRPGCRVEVEADRRLAIEAAIAEARPGDTVLIAGKGHETYQLVGDNVLSFDDAEEARRCLDALAAVEGVA